MKNYEYYRHRYNGLIYRIETIQDRVSFADLEYNLGWSVSSKSSIDIKYDIGKYYIPISKEELFLEFL